MVVDLSLKKVMSKFTGKQSEQATCSIGQQFLERNCWHGTPSSLLAPQGYVDDSAGWRKPDKYLLQTLWGGMSY